MTATPAQYDIIRRPVITEKATMASESNAVVFEVAQRGVEEPHHGFVLAVQLQFHVGLVVFQVVASHHFAFFVVASPSAVSACEVKFQLLRW